MYILSNDVLKFSTGNDDINKGYAGFCAYMDAFEKGKATHKMHLDVREFFVNEIARFAKCEPKDVYDRPNFTRFTSNYEATFAVIDIMLNLITPNYLKKYDAISEIRYGAWNDTFKFTVPNRDLFSVSKVGSNKRRFNLQRQYTNETTLYPEMRGLTVGIPLWEIIEGRTSLGDYMSKAARSMDVAMQQDILEAFISFFENIPVTPPYDKIKMNGWDDEGAAKIARRVKEWNGGADVIYFGTQIALQNVLPSNTNFRFNLEDPYVANGFITQVGRTRLVEMDTVVDLGVEFGIFEEDALDKRIYVLCPSVDKLVKMAVAGEGMSNVDGNFDNANLMVTGTLRKAWDVQVITNAVAGVINLP